MGDAVVTRKKIFRSTYASYDLAENPFHVHALGADDRGIRLLIGRDREISLVSQRLHKHGKITCLDGHVGVGKTSLVNVAAYECFNAFLSGDTDQLLIPMKESFQLKKDEDVKDFCQEVYRKVAQTLINHRTHLSGYSGSSEIIKKIDPWINSPVVTHLSNALGFNVNGGIPGVFSAGGKSDYVESKQLNTSPAFSEQGFEQLVKNWLNEIFGAQGNGGVVCVIDNLELLETGVSARRTLEALRDKLFNVSGLRWVFCGANGVIHSLAASPRLSSYMSTPVIDVAHIAPEYIGPLIKARLDEFRVDSGAVEEKLPIKLADLGKLYFAVNFNLRDMLGLADDYCEHMYATGKIELSDDQKMARFDKWLNGESINKYSALQSRLPSDAWIVLDIAMSPECNGTFGVGDYDVFNSNSRKNISKTTFDKWLKDYIKLGMISKSIDDDSTDDGFRRDVFTVTAKGSLVHYARLLKGDTKHSSQEPMWLKRVHAK